MSGRSYHIAHILPSPFVGGTELATLRIARAAESASFLNTLFCPSEPGPVRDLFTSNGFPTVSYRAVEPSYRHPQNFLRASLELAREFRQRKIDLIHCADILGAYYAGVAGKLAGLPVLCHVRCRHSELSRRDQSFLRAVDRFVFVSRHTWQHFGYRVPPRRGRVVYDGIDVGGDDETGEAGRSVRREFGIPTSAKIIGMVARVTPVKDYATLIKAAARVIAVDSHVRFVIVGDCSEAGPSREHYREVKRLLAERNLAPYFIFTDHRDDVTRMISAMDVSVLSTHTEGLPLVILEAMAQAKPVVATAVGGVPEIVVDGQTGLLHQPQRDDDLAAHILDLLGSPQLCARLGEAGRNFIKTNFSREQFARGMADQYHDILSGRTPRGAKGLPRRRFGRQSPSDVA